MTQHTDSATNKRQTPDSDQTDPRHPASNPRTNGPTETPRSDRGGEPDDPDQQDDGNTARDREPAEGEEATGGREQMGEKGANTRR